MAKEISTIISTNQNPPTPFHTISSCHKQAGISFGNTKIQALVDTGAKVNILVESNVPHHVRRIFHTPSTLQPYGSTIITPKGQITLDTTWNNATKRATWIVIDDNDLQGIPCNLISCTLAESLGIISFNGSLAKSVEFHATTVTFNLRIMSRRSLGPKFSTPHPASSQNMEISLLILEN